MQELSKAKIVQALLALHKPYDLYEDCGHNHLPLDNRAFEIEGLGRVCSEGIVATICIHCCTDFVGGSYIVRDVCVDEHKHLPGYSLCPTLAIVEGKDAPWRP